MVALTGSTLEEIEKVASAADEVAVADEGVEGAGEEAVNPLSDGLTTTRKVLHDYSQHVCTALEALHGNCAALYRQYIRPAIDAGWFSADMSQVPRDQPLSTPGSEACRSQWSSKKSRAQKGPAAFSWTGFATPVCL